MFHRPLFNARHLARRAGQSPVPPEHKKLLADWAASGASCLLQVRLAADRPARLAANPTRYFEALRSADRYDLRPLIELWLARIEV